MDSIAAARALSKSARLRAIVAFVWPILLPVLTAFGAWTLKSWRTDEQFVELNLAVKRMEQKQEETNQRLAGFILQEQRRALTIGRQAAYATAGFQAAETTKARKEKLLYATKYAVAYERIVMAEGRDPETAYFALFPPKEAELP